MTFQTEELPASGLKIIFSGRLDIANVTDLWQSCLNLLVKKKPTSLILDLKNIDYCDGAGIALLQTLQKEQTQNNAAFAIENLKPELQHLLDYIKSQPAQICETPALQKKLWQKLQNFSAKVVENVRDNIIFLGNLSYQLFLALLRPKKIRWRDLWLAAEATGPKALPIVALIGFLIGLISTFQAAPSFREFGAQIYLIDLVALGLVREMGPLMTAVLLAGRTASAYAAELGTMKINQEVDALTTMGLNPVRFLIVPRLLATVIMTPIINIFLIVFGLVGCFIVMRTLGYHWDAFLHELYTTVTMTDCIGGLIKAFVFGWVIAGVGCLHGLKTRFGAQAIGSSTTQAVVSSLIMLVITDGLFAVIYYVLGV